MKTLFKGAEATIYKSPKKNTVIKSRDVKSYRHPEIDEKIRKRRTKAEVKILQKIEKIIPAPKIISNEDSGKIEMQYIPGKKLSEKLLPKSYKLIGKNLALLHDAGIIHGDLTTSNMIYQTKTKKLFFIDFGLSFHSDRPEDKAVDLHLLAEAINAKHPKEAKKAFPEIIKSYKKHSKHAQRVLKQLEKVERRGRYKEQY